MSILLAQSGVSAGGDRLTLVRCPVVCPPFGVHQVRLLPYAGRSLAVAQNPDPVANLVNGIVLLNDDEQFAVVELNLEFHALRGGHPFFDCRTGNAAKDGAADGGDDLTAAATDGTPQSPAHGPAGHRPRSGLGPLDGDQIDAQDRAVVDRVTGSGLVAGVDIAGAALGETAGKQAGCSDDHNR